MGGPFAQRRRCSVSGEPRGSQTVYLLFASGFTIRGAHQTGKDRWDSVGPGKPKPEASLIKGSVGRSSGLPG